MKKHYDKILFVVALLAVGASVACFLKVQGDVASSEDTAKAALAKASGGDQWKNVDVPSLKLESKSWARVKPQDEEGLWLYQLFTSPKIWVDSDGKFIVEPPFQETLMRKTFGFKFGSVKNEPYSIKYKGYFIGPDQEVMVQLYDEANNYSMIGKLNEEISVRKPMTGEMMKSGIKVVNFEKKSEKDEEKGIVTHTTRVVLHDANLGRNVEIFSDKPTFLEEKRVLTLLPDSGQDKAWEIKAVGDTFESPAGKYTVKELNFEDESVVVEKISPKGVTPPSQTIKLSKDGFTKVK